MTKTDWALRILEYCLALLFIRGGLLIFFLAEPPLEVPALLTLLVGELAIRAYGLFFFMTGLLLIYSKVFKKVILHKWILFIMFLTCVYVFALSTALTGLSWNQWLTVVVGLVSAALWLRWKMKYDYLSREQFNQMYQSAVLQKE